MSYRKLDTKGKPIPRNGRSTRKPAEKMINGKPHFHYEIAGAIPQPDGKRLQYRKRFWLLNDYAADAKEREILHKPPSQALTWMEAHRRWVDANRAKFSPLHIANTEITLKQWCASFGASATIEGTTLAAFSGWVEEKAKEGKGRGAQLKYGHLLAIARWCRARGMVDSVPFEHAPKPEARIDKRKPAEVGMFFKYMEILPPHMVTMWKMLGLTGMRISAACTLLEDDITDTEFTVTTKGDKRVTYSITPDLATVIEEARAFKRKGVLKGKGKSRKLVPVGSEYLFVNSRGVRWNKGAFNNQLQRHRTDAGLPKITSHQLRHMAGTLAGEKGLDAIVIKALLAHESLKSTEGYVDKTQKMRDQGLAVVADSLQIFTSKNADPADRGRSTTNNHDPDSTLITCPHCYRNFSIAKE